MPQEMRIYLPNGLEVTPKVLEERFPHWFTPDHLQAIPGLIISSWNTWGMRRSQLVILHKWRREHARECGRDKRWLLAVLLTGTASKSGFLPDEMLDLFDKGGGRAGVLLSQGVRLTEPEYRTRAASN